MEQSYYSFLGTVLQEIAAELDERGSFNSRNARDIAAIRAGIGRLKLEAMGRDVRSRFGAPWLPLKGLEAVQYLAMQKHGWTAEYARSLDYEGLMFALAEEVHAFQLPAEACEAAIGWVKNHGLWEELKQHLDSPAP